MLYCVQIAILTPLVFVVLYIAINYCIKGYKCVCIVVLGDIGRSPRMLNHATSLADSGYFVNIVGYIGSEPQKRILDDANIEVNSINEAPTFCFAGPISDIFKALWMSTSLLLTMLLLPKSYYILVQNPPGVPTMPVVYLVCWLRNCQWILDWHNYSYTILALKRPPRSRMVSVVHGIEKVFGRLASANICVSKHMQYDLAKHWNIRAETVYDRPKEVFKATTLEEKHNLFTKLSSQYPEFATGEGGNIMTMQDGSGVVVSRTDRPALLVSSTSWTVDEDFEILLNAMKNYDLHSPKRCPSILCVITGRGPQRANYQVKIAKTTWQRVRFCLPWLTAEDYPILLGSADLGVCLHMSSSGLDLPMKVVDMFGCGVPVCAFRYDCIEELVQHGETGLLFADCRELSDQLEFLLQGFPDNDVYLCTLRQNVEQKFQADCWHHQWENAVLPMFSKKDRNA